MKKIICLAATWLTLGLVLQVHAEDAKPDLGAPQSGIRQEMMDITAKVLDIDYSTRLVTLEDAGGGTLTLRADDAVKNLNKVKKGDRVEIKYQRTVSWRLLPKKTTTTETRTKSVTTKPGKNKPEVTRTSETNIVATILSIDKSAPTVTLKEPDGKSFTVKIRNPSVLEGVKVGDQVDLSYTESVAAFVKKVKK